MQNTKDFNYFSSIKDNVLLIYREIRRATYKTIFNKILEYIDYTNKIMRKLIDDALKQIHLLFERCLQERIQST